MTTHQGSANFTQEVIAAIASVAGSGTVALHEPEFDGNEWDYVKECLDSNFVSSAGLFVDKFERNLEDYTGSRHVIAVANGTSALHISLLLAGVRSGDEVLVPALTFVATANAVIYCGAEPHFVDCEEETLGVNPSRLREYLKLTTSLISGECRNNRTGRIIRGIVPVHTFGHPAKIEELLEVCSEFCITMVEDAAESLGSLYSLRHTGTFGLLGTLSFNGNKIITTGGGGAILTNNSELAKRAKHLTTTAKVPHKWRYSHDEIGYNYRLPNLNAALGCAQLENIEKKIEKKRKIFDIYNETFTAVNDISLFHEPLNCRSNYWLQTLLLNTNKISFRDQILDQANKVNLQLRPAWELLNTLNQFKGCESMDLEIATRISERIINIPSSSALLK